VLQQFFVLLLFETPSNPFKKGCFKKNPFVPSGLRDRRTAVTPFPYLKGVKKEDFLFFLKHPLRKGVSKRTERKEPSYVGRSKRKVCYLTKQPNQTKPPLTQRKNSPSIPFPYPLKGVRRTTPSAGKVAELLPTERKGKGDRL